VSAEANIALIREGMDVLNGEGPSALLERYDEVFTDDFRWAPALVSGIEGRQEYRGREGFAEYWRDFQSSFSEVEYHPLEFGTVGEETVWVSARAVLRGTESGVQLEQRIGWVFRFEGAKIAFGETFWTPEEAQAAAERWAHA
jgi:ketosteroid isomerase-like protein